MDGSWTPFLSRRVPYPHSLILITICISLMKIKDNLFEQDILVSYTTCIFDARIKQVDIAQLTVNKRQFTSNLHHNLHTAMVLDTRRIKLSFCLMWNHYISMSVKFHLLIKLLLEDYNMVNVGILQKCNAFVSTSHIFWPLILE